MTRPLFRTTQRISMTLPYATCRQLIERSVREGRSISSLAAFLLEVAAMRAVMDWEGVGDDISRCSEPY